jgi:ATP-binding cassette subfamily B protein
MKLNLKKLAKYFVPYLWALAILIGLVWAQSYVNLALPDYTSKIVNLGIVGKNIDAIWSNGSHMLLLTLLGGVCAIGVGFIAARISTGFTRRVREAVFTKVEGFSLDEFNKFSASSLVTRSTNDMQQIQNVISMILRIAFLAPFMGVGSIIKAHQMAPTMSWIVIVAIGVMMAMIIVLFVVAVPKFTIIQKLVDTLSLQTREMLTGVRVIRAYNKDGYQQKKFNKTNKQSTDLNTFVNRLMMLMQPLMTLVMGLSAVAVIWVGSYVINSGILQVGNLLALMQYVSQTIMAFLMISMIFIMVPRAAVSGKRIGEILNTRPSIADPKKADHLPEQIGGLVEFRDVSFGYYGSEQKVLESISFEARPGQLTAIIGGTSSGKSTILNLIPRLYDVSSGVITIDGVDIRDIPQTELHAKIGYVPQKASLFSGTIKSNIIYGNPEASDDDIKHAIDIAQASEYINGLPKKLKSAVSESGNNLSGGQKQRISIARALVKQPQIYLFDDSFSALDFKTDAALRKALRKETAQATFIIVAQRISTIMKADKIIVVDEGKIVGMGRHEELLGTSPEYREIAESQLSANELLEEA